MLSETQEEKFHINKQPCIILFTQYTIALYWQENSTLVINEIKRIDNPRIKIVKCVGAKAQDEKNVLNHYKKNNVRSF